MASKYVVAAQPASRSFDSTGETTERVGFKSIVVATDFSSAAEKGLRYAIEIARRDSAMLHVVHILGPAVYPMRRLRPGRILQNRTGCPAKSPRQNWRSNCRGCGTK
jgi:hypothetical protein